MLNLTELHAEANNYGIDLLAVRRIHFCGVIALTESPTHHFSVYHFDLIEDGEEIVRWLIVRDHATPNTSEAFQAERDLNEILTNYADKEGNLNHAIYDAMAHKQVTLITH